MNLAELSSPEIAPLAPHTPVVVPIAAMEQHGLHLPLATDSMLLGEVLSRVEPRLQAQVLFCPLQWLGEVAVWIVSMRTTDLRPRDDAEDRVDFLLAEFVFARRPQALRRPERVGRSMRSDLNVEIDIPAAAAFQQPISTYRCPTDLIPSDFSGADPRNDDANFPLGKSNDVGINDSGNGLKKHLGE